MACMNPQCIRESPHAAGPGCLFGGADVLGRVSGLGKEEVKAIWAKVKDNHARLDACPGPHEFLKTSDRPTIGPAYRCVKCGGTISTTAHAWYERGLTHGRSPSSAGAGKGET